MIVDYDQPKRIVDCHVVDQQNGLTMELVEFEIAANKSKAFGCRVFSKKGSSTTELYDNDGEAIEAGYLLKVVV